MRTVNNGNNVWLTEDGVEGIWIKFGTGTPHEKDIFVYEDKPYITLHNMTRDDYSEGKDPPDPSKKQHRAMVDHEAREVRRQRPSTPRSSMSKLEMLIIFVLGCLCGYIANSVIWIYLL